MKLIILNREILPNDADLLTEATINSFGNMCLSGEMHLELCHKIIQYIKSGAPMEVRYYLEIVIYPAPSSKLKKLLK